MTSPARAFRTNPRLSDSAPSRHAYSSRVTSGASQPSPASTTAPERPNTRAPFSPDPAQTDSLISAIASDFNSSLAGLAEEYNTTLESLTLWMTRPDIAERLDALQSACAARVRVVAANFLPLAVETLRSVLADFRELHCNALCDTSSPRAIATRARAAENARRAASTLLRLAHFTPRGWRTQLAPVPISVAPSAEAMPFSPRPAATPACAQVRPFAQAAQAPAGQPPPDLLVSPPPARSSLAEPGTRVAPTPRPQPGAHHDIGAHATDVPSLAHSPRSPSGVRPPQLRSYRQTKDTPIPTAGTPP